MSILAYLDAVDVLWREEEFLRSFWAFRITLGTYGVTAFIFSIEAHLKLFSLLLKLQFSFSHSPLRFIFNVNKVFIAVGQKQSKNEFIYGVLF